jgi:protocatechuate 3,4-dioxygenase beta subunit
MTVMSLSRHPHPLGSRAEEPAMPDQSPILDRRGFIGLVARSGIIAGGLVACAGGRVAAADPTPTPAQTEGPFYPDKLPLDRDNDLLQVDGATVQAKGVVTHLGGRVLDPHGRPVAGAVVEIWQCDANGIYLHTRGGDRARIDAGFQGFGTCRTGADGAYRFRTIRPVAYPGRTPHIHVLVRHGGRGLLTTQCYVNGDPGNERDGVLRGLAPEERKLLLTDFLPKDGTAGELAARFDLVLGVTPTG